MTDVIILYSGTPGSGKSLHVAERISTKLRAGRPVIANFDFNAARAVGKCRRVGDFSFWPNDEFTPERLASYSDHYFENHRYAEDFIFVVIDEAQLMFNAREWDAKGRKEWLSFFTQHRKYGMQIVLVAQFDRMLDRQIRSVIEYEYIHRKVSNFGIMGKLLSAFALGKLFCAVKMWYPLRERIGADWFVARRRYYSLYDTYNKFDYEKSKEKASEMAHGAPDRDASAVAVTDSGVKFYEIA